MKKLKKFKRFEKGGLTDSSGNPVLSGDGTPISTGGKGAAAYLDSLENEDYSKQKEQGAKNLESIKNFFMGRRSKDEASAPIEERKPPKAEEAKPAKVEPVKAEPAKTEKVESPRVRDSAKDAAETSYDYPTQRDSKRDDYEGSASPTSGGQTFKRSTPAAPKTPKETKYGGEPINISTGASGFGKSSTSSAAPKAPKSASPDQIPGTDVKTPYEGEKVDNKNLGLKQFAQSTLGATAAGRTLGAGARGAIGLGRMFESAAKPEGKGTGKIPEAKPDTVSSKPAVERVKEAKIEGPPASAAAPKPKSATEEMGLRDTPSMERMRKAKEAAKEGPPDRLRLKTPAQRKGLEETPSMARMREAKASAKEGPPAPPKTKTPAEEMGVRETSAMEKSRKANEVGPRDLGARTRRAQKRSDAIPQKDREPGYMQEYIAGRAEKRNRIKDLPNDGLSAERFANKKGGKIPAFKKGGLVGRGDGCAMRGKTKGRMV